MINAGTITAWLTLDTNRFNAGMESASAQLKAFNDGSLTAGEKLQGVGGALTTIGGTLTRNVTLPLVGAGAAAIKVAADFDSGMSKVAAISGATGEDLDKLRDKAREMGSKTKFSASEAADAMSYMAMAGWKTCEMLDGIEGIMNLAAASGEDLATTSDIVTDALTAFGLKASDSAHFSDILAAASSNANTNVSLMGETFKYVAPVAGALGISAEDTAEAVGLMANSGIKGSQAGTALRSVLTRLSTDAGASSKSLGALGILTKELGVEFYDSKGKVRDFGDILSEARVQWKKLSQEDAAEFAEKIAGKNGISGWLALMNSAPEDIQKLSDAIANCDGTASRMADTMQDNLQGQLTILKSQAEELAIGFGSQLMPVAQDLVGVASSAVQAFSGLSDGTKKFITYAGLAAAAAGPLTTGIGSVVTAGGKLVSTVGTMATAFSTAGGGIAGVGSALTALIGPAGWVVLAIGAVTAAGIALYAMTKDADKGTRELGDAFKGAAEGAKSFYEEVQNGGSVNLTSSFTSELNSGTDMNDLQQKISNTQKKISDIISKASSERRKLTKKDIKALKKYYNELRKLHEEQSKYYSNNLTALVQAVNDGLELNEESAKEILEQGKANMDAALKAEKQAHFERIGVIEKTYADDEAARKKAMEQENADYDKHVEEIKTAFADLTSAVTSGYAEQNLAEDEYYQNMQKFNADVEEENKRHADMIEEIRENANNKYEDQGAALEAEEARHTNAMEDLRNQFGENLKNVNSEVISSQLGLLATLQNSHGELTTENQEFINQFMGCYDNLPEDVRKDMDETIAAMNLKGRTGEVIDSVEALCNDIIAATEGIPSGMAIKLNDGKPELVTAAKEEMTAIKDTIISEWDMHSPSRVAATMGGNIIDGLNQGMESKKPSAVSAISGIMQGMLTAAGSVSFTGIGGNIVGGIIRGINSKKPSLITTASNLAAGAAAAARRALGINSPSRVMMEVGKFTAEGMELGLKQGSRGIYRTASAISDEAAAALGSISTRGLNLSRVHSTNYGDRLDRLLDAVEKLADSRTTMEIDGRPFGRLVREARSGAALR